MRPGLVCLVSLLALAQATSISLPSKLQSTVIEVALRFGRSESVADQLALLSMPKRELLRNITGLLYQLRLDRINIEIEHGEFIEEHEAAIDTINDNIMDDQVAINDDKEKLRNLDDDLQTIRDDIEASESVAAESLSESQMFAAKADELISEFAERRAEYEAQVSNLEASIQMIEHVAQMKTADDAIAYMQNLDISNEYVADCIAAVSTSNATKSLNMIRDRIMQRLELLAAFEIGAETRFNLTIGEYQAVIGEYRDEYEAINAQIEELDDQHQQLVEQREIVQTQADSIQDRIDKSEATIKLLARAMVKETFDYSTRAKVINAELDDLDAVAMLINVNMTGDLWPGLCRIGDLECRRCLYDEHCHRRDGQICSEDGLCIDDSVQI